jgi:hypothetical protein
MVDDSVGVGDVVGVAAGTGFMVTDAVAVAVVPGDVTAGATPEAVIAVSGVVGSVPVPSSDPSEAGGSEEHERVTHKREQWRTKRIGSSMRSPDTYYCPAVEGGHTRETFSQEHNAC